jgi:hypothetical protein
MEKTDYKLEETINRLRKSKPVLNHGDELTEKIMNSISERKTNTLERIIVLVRPWISAAAVFLIGLYIFQQNEEPITEIQKVYTPKKENQITVDCLSSVSTSQGENLLENYYCYVKQSELKNKNAKQLMLKLLENYN